MQLAVDEKAAPQQVRGVRVAADERQQALLFQRPGQAFPEADPLGQ